MKRLYKDIYNDLIEDNHRWMTDRTIEEILFQNNMKIFLPFHHQNKVDV